MSHPGMMNYGAVSQTSELPLAPLRTRTCVLLGRPCTETILANKGPVGLWIREPYRGFNAVLFIPPRKGSGANSIHFAMVTHNNVFCVCVLILFPYAHMNYLCFIYRCRYLEQHVTFRTSNLLTDLK